MRRVILALFILCSCANAFFVDATIQDSRIVGDNSVYKPQGIVGFAFEVGAFNETENTIDYTLALGIRRYGYSYYDGEKEAVSWEIEFKPLIWTVWWRNLYVEAYAGIGKNFAGINYSPYAPRVYKEWVFNYGSRFGYRVNQQFMVGVTYTKQYILGVSNKMPFLGGWGLNVQYNLPW